MNRTQGDPAFVRGQAPDDFPEPRAADRAPRPSAQPPPLGGARPWLIALLVASAVGAIFSAVSTSDFMQHLDRQVHSIHCSFIPGTGSEIGESGCRTVMMSPWSSFFRESIWGGIPVALWALAVFAFLAYRAAVLLMKGAARRGELLFLLVATGLPAAMTLVYAYLSIAKVGATCKVCVGIYAASAVALLGAFMAWRRAPGALERGGPKPRYALWFAQGVAFVAILSIAYLAFTPRSDQGADRSCGALVRGDDPSGVMISLTDRGSVPAIEVLDPLCPSCRAFDARLDASSLGDDLALKGVLFPLDSRCNWMVTEELHPGACLVSEAVLCANGLGAQKDPAAARAVLDWAFAHQEELRTLAKTDEGALKRTIETNFPNVKGCVGGYAAKNKLTRSLRWAVANAIPVLTPQLFVRDTRVCDEDTDLGLEYTLRRLLDKGPAPAQEARR